MAKNDARTKLNVAAQMLFDCQMELLYKAEGYGIDGFLTKIGIAKAYVADLTANPDFDILRLLFDDCEQAIKESSDFEYLVQVFQAPITFIDKNFQ